MRPMATARSTPCSSTPAITCNSSQSSTRACACRAQSRREVDTAGNRMDFDARQVDDAPGRIGRRRSGIPHTLDPASPISGPGGTGQNRRMELEFSRGELAILHCLRDGDDPCDVARGSDPASFDRDIERLLNLGMIQRSCRRLALTLEGLEQLDAPRNSGPMPLDDYDVECRDWEIR